MTLMDMLTKELGLVESTDFSPRVTEIVARMRVGGWPCATVCRAEFGGRVRFSMIFSGEGVDEVHVTGFDLDEVAGAALREGHRQYRARMSPRPRVLEGHGEGGQS